LLEAQAPTWATLALPDLGVSVQAPSFPGISNQFNFVEEEYSSLTRDTLKQEISRVLGGDLGVPAFVWQAGWAKAVAQLQRQAQARKRAARRNWSKLGWEMPGGLALAETEQAEMDVNQAISEQVLEKTLQEQLQKREDFWEAVKQGQVLEQQLFTEWNSYQERQLKAAVAYQEASISTYNALVAEYNAVLQYAQAQTAVKELALRGAVTRLEERKLELERARVSGEIDSRRLQQYESEWGGVRAEAEVYSQELRGVEVDLQAQRALIEAYGERVKANQTIIQAWGQEWQGYGTKIEAERLKLGVEDIYSKVFDSETKAFEAAVQAAAAAADT
jgi:hypothetical protein